MKRILLCGLLFFITSSYSYGQDTNALSLNEKETITLEIQELLSNFHNDIIENGLTSEIKYLDDSPDFFWLPLGYKSELNYQELKSILQLNSKTANFTEFSWESLKIQPITKNVANYSGVLKCVQIDQNNNPMAFKIKESGTLIKREKGWKFLNGQSTNLPKSNN